MCFALPSESGLRRRGLGASRADGGGAADAHCTKDALAEGFEGFKLGVSSCDGVFELVVLEIVSSEMVESK
jgi:hypothetical protein